MFSIHRFNVFLLSSVALAAAADTFLWEPGKVVAVEQVSSPAKEPDPSCRAVPRGTTPPPRCRPANLRAEQYWNVTVDVGNKRLVVRPYKSPKLFDSLNQAEAVYVDPNLSAGASVEVAVVSSKAVRLRTDQGQGLPAILDSQALLSNAEVPRRAEPAVAPISPNPPTTPASPRPRAAVAVTSPFKVVLLENSDFVELEVQESKSQEIGDGAAIYSFAGDSSQARVGSNTPVFLILAESENAGKGNVELSRLQIEKGNRQMVYSVTKNRSASSVPISVTQVSATVRKVSVREPLASGEYVVHLENSDRGFLFRVR